ncbi:MAG: hypothetical protein ABSG78_10390 [Verrucomicrobiota bacterium]|jgi:hypothetical protein
MSKLSEAERDVLLRGLSDMGAGQAESENAEMFCQRFHPVPEHVRAFAPDSTLVIGERGSGKSELFRAAVEFDLLQPISAFAPSVRLPPLEKGKTQWIQGYPVGAGFPAPAGLQRFIGGDKSKPGEVQNLWFAYLLRSLKPHLAQQDTQALADLLAPQGAEISRIMEAFSKAEEAAVLAIDRLDQTLLSEGRWIFIGYDELDTLGGYDWRVMGETISGLVSFWASYLRRWRRVRAKIFMRTDLFRRNTAGPSADLPKLAANRADLYWSDKNLYAMLVKRIANTSEQLLQYCQSANISFKEPHPKFGGVPNIERAEAAQPLVNRMIGQYMGANQNKGLTFNWLLDHIRDGQDKAYPRALVRLIEQAAMNELESPKAARDHLLHPTSVRRAIDEVSKLQVKQAVSNEWPWLDGVKHRIQSESVPMSRRELENLLRRDWDKPWSQVQDVRPPADDARNLVNYLVELGIMRERGGDRLDAPDLYQSGLGLTRKGGVRRY